MRHQTAYGQAALVILTLAGCGQRSATPAFQGVRPESAFIATLERDVTRYETEGIVLRYDGADKVYVGRRFYDGDFGQRERIARDINDYRTAIAGKFGVGTEFDLYDGQTGDRIYHWDGHHLTRP